MAMNLLLALTGPPAMSALWSLTGGKRTWQGKLISVAIDPKRKEVALNDAKLVGAMSCRFRDPELNLETRFNVSKSTKLLVTVSRV